MKFRLLPTFAVVCALLLVSAVYSQSFEKLSGDSLVDLSNKIVQVGDDIYVFGSTNSYSPLKKLDSFLAKLNKSGDLKSLQTFGGGKGDEINDILVDDTVMIMVGSTENFGTGGLDFYVIKADTSGNVLWSRVYGGSDNEKINSVVKANGYLFAGSTAGFGAGSEDFLVVRTDSFGVMLWAKTYGGISRESLADAKAVNDSTFILSGTYNMGFKKGDAYLVKLNAKGDTIWTRTYGGGGNSHRGGELVVNDDGGYTVTGYTQSFGAGGEDVFLMRLDSLGNLLWYKTYGGAKHDRPTGIIRTPSGYALSGRTMSYGNGIVDGFIMTVDEDGTLQWFKTYGTSVFDELVDINGMDDMGYLATGRMNDYGLGSTDSWTVRTDSLGNSGSCYEVDHTDSVMVFDTLVNVISPADSITVAALIQDTAETLTENWNAVQTDICDPVAQFSVKDTATCTGDCFTLNDESLHHPNKWEWVLNGQADTLKTIDPKVCLDTVGSYDVTLIVYNLRSSDTLHMDSLINVRERLKSVVLGVDSTVICIDSTATFDAGAGFMSYEWSTGDSLKELVVDTSGMYYVTVTDSAGCVSSDTVVVELEICMGTEELAAATAKVSAYPVPADNLINIEISGSSESLELELFSISGELLQRKSLPQGIQTARFEIEGYAKGVYLLRVISHDGKSLASLPVIKR